MMRGMRGIHGDDWVRRYCMHFLMFYHAGEAVTAANEEWTWGRYEYEFENLKRGTERRYFRGTQGGNALKRLAKASESPQSAFESMVGPTYSALRALFNRGPFANCCFGDYFVWKVLDLQTRVMDQHITLSLEEACRYLPTEPKEAALGIFLREKLSLEDALMRVKEVIQNMHLPFGGPGYCGLQEAETVLCMIKGAFLTKTHQIGDDIEDKKKAMEDYPQYIRLLPFSVLGKYQLGALNEVATT